MTKHKIILFDIETTNLDSNIHIGAYHAHMLCFAWQISGEKKVHSKSLLDFPKDYKKDPHNDEKLVGAAYAVLSQADALAGHFSSKFDLPFINSRLLKYGMFPIDTRTKHYDTWRIAKYKMKFNSNRLNVLAEHLGCELKEKSNPTWWYDAVKGGKVGATAIRKMEHYCRQDVTVLGQCFEKVRPLIGDFSPVTTNTLACPACGSTSVISNGFRATATRRYRRQQCLDCGSWFKGERV